MGSGHYIQLRGSLPRFSGSDCCSLVEAILNEILRPMRPIIRFGDVSNPLVQRVFHPNVAESYPFLLNVGQFLACY
jgi:hypothetical protein